jgi:hypothetical protein
MRKHCGIKPFEPANRPWTKAEIKMLGKLPDSVVAARVNRSKLAIINARTRFKISPAPGTGMHARRWNPRWDKLLGKATDKDVAKKIGRTMAAVRTRRNKLGIPLNKPLRRDWTPEEEKLLGTDYDFVIAKRINRKRPVVQRRREQLGIRPFKFRAQASAIAHP